MTIQAIQRMSTRIRRDAGSQFIRARVLGVRAEIKRETDAEIRAAVRAMMSGELSTEPEPGFECWDSDCGQADAGEVCA